ncbi:MULTISPECIES: FtsX-like permease family protein [unclassified Hydrotalea]|uniref:ABC transporter permease n=1 Tax=unclassified Hydrotalea TaxID=2643788 RepID=UPI0009436494|nr:MULTISPECIES: FtsX-like permease family protein [unclassified Hydrotalea]RWZ86340.1 MAG: ABC transporter permease [Hydrotalea sp. AMD]
MILKLIVNIAQSLLMARWRQTLVAAVGVTFGITMFIALLSFMSGLNDLLDGLVVNRTPHIRLYNDIRPHKDQPVTLWPAYRNSYPFISSLKSGNIRQEIYNSGPIIQALQQNKQVMGVAPTITAQVFFNDGTVDINGAINGIDVAAETKLFHFDDYIVAGKAADLNTVPNSIVLGKALAEKLVANVGDVVQITTSTGSIFQLKVVGYFQSGLQDFDKAQSYASIQTVQKILGKSSLYITDIRIKLYDINRAPALAKTFARIYGVDGEDIQTANSQFETGSFVRSLISYAVGITLLIVAGFGIYNILNMMIYEKMDTIAILKATGFAGRDVKAIFLVIAIGIGLFGGFTGLLSGFGLSVLIHHVPFHTAALPTVKTYPINYNPLFYLIGISFSLITTYLAGWLPARKASKIDPVIIIRGK